MDLLCLCGILQGMHYCLLINVKNNFLSIWKVRTIGIILISREQRNGTQETLVLHKSLGAYIVIPKQVKQILTTVFLKITSTVETISEQMIWFISSFLAYYYLQRINILKTLNLCNFDKLHTALTIRVWHSQLDDN